MHLKIAACKRIALSIGLLLVFFSVGFSQKGYRGTVKEYFRVDPFAGSFSAFVDALTSDTALHNKEVYKKTADTLFFMRGNYKIFNPFRINADTVAVAFVERMKDIGNKVYTYYSYQIGGIFPDTGPNRQALKKEFKKLKRSFSVDYQYSDYTSLKEKDNEDQDGEVEVFRGSAPVSPVIILWQTEKQQLLSFAILVNLQQFHNVAYPASSSVFLQ